MPVQVQKRILTVQEYHRMGETGILQEDEHLELINGEIIQMTPIGSYHASCVAKLTRLLGQSVADSAIVWVQNPIQVGESSEPEPDIALLKPRLDFYAEHHPRPKDVFLIIEVADTSVEYDRETKLPLYAKAGIPEVWIVNLKGQCIEVYTELAEQEYEILKKFRRGKVITSTQLPELHIAVEEVLTKVH